MILSWMFLFIPRIVTSMQSRLVWSIRSSILSLLVGSHESTAQSCFRLSYLSSVQKIHCSLKLSISHSMSGWFSVWSWRQDLFNRDSVLELLLLIISGYLGCFFANMIICKCSYFMQLDKGVWEAIMLGFWSTTLDDPHCSFSFYSDCSGAMLTWF